MAALNKFIKAQISSFISTVVDFGCTIFLKEVCGICYLFSTSIGSVLGGVTNFELGRKWVFKASGIHLGSQAVRYFMVWAGSILLNIGGVYLLTSVCHFNYLVSKIITAINVGIFFNYLLQKTYVFKTKHENQETASI
jgi:putative flippase GtrA